jgi:hypothetical protein
MYLLPDSQFLGEDNDYARMLNCIKDMETANWSGYDKHDILKRIGPENLWVYI